MLLQGDYCMIVKKSNKIVKEYKVFSEDFAPESPSNCYNRGFGIGFYSLE
jgi:hypothetical protein